MECSQFVNTSCGINSNFSSNVSLSRTKNFDFAVANEVANEAETRQRLETTAFWRHALIQTT